MAHWLIRWPKKPPPPLLDSSAWRLGVLFALDMLRLNLNRIEAKLDALTAKEAQIVATIADIQAKVTATKGKVESLIVLTGEIAQAIRDNKNDPAALDAIAADLDATTAETQAALDTNADVDPTP